MIIPVTKTYLPPLEHYQRQLERIWQKGWITNNGPLSRELQAALAEYLEVPNLELVANGTVALQLAIKVFGLQGEIITTPYSYVATTTSILWENCEPVFVDIEDQTYCIDINKIEAAITDRSSAILATHVYGYPCDVAGIERLAQKYNLKVIYDAAHAFGVKLYGRSILDYGDISTLSFHATKLFHTGEGGGVVCTDDSVAGRIGLMKKFGHIGEDEYLEMGINAKMSEMHAAMGLCVLPRIDEIIACRRSLSQCYDAELEQTRLIHSVDAGNFEYNFAYYPVVFSSHEVMMRVRQALMDHGIMPRRYFSPSLNTLPYLAPELKISCPVSENIASRVLCLPLYFGLAQQDVERICKVIIERAT